MAASGNEVPLLSQIKALKDWIATQLSGKANTSHTHAVANSSSAGFMPKLNNTSNMFLNGQGEFASVPAPDGNLTADVVDMVLRSVTFNDVTLTLNRAIQFYNLKRNGSASQIYLLRANTIGANSVNAASTSDKDVKAFDIQKVSIDLGYSGNDGSVDPTRFIKAFCLYNTITKCNAIFTPTGGLFYACAGYAGDELLYASASAQNPMIFFLISSI